MIAQMPMPSPPMLPVLPFGWSPSAVATRRSAAVVVPVRKSVPVQTDRLTMAVIRLMTIAVQVMGDTSEGHAAFGPTIPSGFREWPCHEMDVAGRTATRLRCYVSPSTMVAGDPETCPIGTKFVVERAVARGRSRTDDGLRRWRRVSCFVMSKYGTVTLPHGGERELWSHALYGGGDVREALPLWHVQRIDE
ncbi:MAG: hypothetical protein U0172_08580 [Nitrospiraceae bacterium]